MALFRRFAGSATAALTLAAAISAQAQEIKIGVSIALTGPAAALGGPIKNTLALVPDKIGGVPVKFVILDDCAYHYMQILQKPAYRRTTATNLARIDYKSFAQAVGVAYQDIQSQEHLEPGLRAAFCHPGPVLIRVQTDYGTRKIRWVEAVRDRYTQELSGAQKARFATRIAGRTLNLRPEKND